MPIVTIPVPSLMTGPLVIYRAPGGTAEPASTVAGSIFTDTWASPWVALGATHDGVRQSTSLDTTDLEAEEFLDPLAVLPTGRTVNVNFTILNFTASVRQAMHNAGSGALTVTGTTTTTKTVLTPTKIADMVNCMIGVESFDATYRAIYSNCLRVGDSESEFRKASRAGTPFTYRAVVDPTTGLPYKEIFAGVARGA